MKIFETDSQQIILRIDKDEELLTTLTNYCSANHITAATFTALGSTGEVVLAYYNLPQKRFEDHTLQEELEITGITGNVAIMNNKHLVHAHGTFSKQDLSVIGGHIKKLIVSATCEIHLVKIEATLTRQFDEDTGLNLLQ